MIRDITFYFLSLVILYWTLSDRRQNENNGKLVVYISWYNGAALFGCYCFYVWVCSNFNRWFRRGQLPSDDSFMCYEAFEVVAPTPSQDENASVSLLCTQFLDREDGAILSSHYFDASLEH